MQRILKLRVVHLVAIVALAVASSLRAAQPSDGHPNAIADDTIRTTSWSLLIEATVQSLHDSLATLGVRMNATSDYDPAYDTPRPPNPPGDYLEVYFPHTGGNWPTMLGTRFGRDIVGPLNPRWAFKIECTLSSGLLRLLWDTAGINRLPEDYHIYMHDSTAGVTINLRQHNGYEFQYSGIRSFSVWAEYNAMFFNVATGWNMVSLPRLTSDSSKLILFPTAVSNAFAFSGTYVVENNLKVGRGYWLKFSESQTLSIGGISLSELTAHLVAGWNLIGTPSQAVHAPPRGGILVSDFFEYTGAYRAADSLRPGKAYWVKASDSGSVTLGSSMAPEKENPMTDSRRWSVLTLRDSDGGRQDLYLADRAEVKEPQCFELPPPPPDGIFDARFASQRYLETYRPGSDEEFSIRVQAAHSPLTISAELLDPRVECTIVTMDGAGDCTSRILDGHSALVIENADNQSLKVVVAPRNRFPGEYRFDQNYPNPFNPSTVVSYHLPERSMVTLEILDVMGRRAACLFSGMQEPGDHLVNIDAQELRLASGTYFCRIQATGTIQATNYRNTKKLIYLK